MLRIKNIEKLIGERMGDWEVKKSEANGGNNWMERPHYEISFNRSGDGAAVLIDRTKNRLLKGYHILICYQSYDRVIHETSLSSEAISNKDTFFSLVLSTINNYTK